MNKWIDGVILGVIVLVAVLLRFTGLDWDEYNHYHPDERYISWVGTSIEWPAEWSTALEPSRSSFNPFYWPSDAASEGILLEQDEQRRFAYGHLPLYLGVVSTRILEQIGPPLRAVLPDEWPLTRDILNGGELNEFGHLTAAGRFLAALFDVATVVVIFFIGRLLFGRIAGLLAAAFLALNVMHIQLSHYFAVDPYLTFFVVLSIAFMILSLRLGQSRPRRTAYLFMAAILVGFAVGSKFSAVLLLIPLSVTGLLDKERSLNTRILHLFAAFLVAFFAFALTNPFAILDLSCEVDSAAINLGPIRLPSLNLSSCFIENMVLQGTMVRGTRDVPFARQYLGTTPYLYFIEMQLRWGMGYILGLAAFGGFGWALWRVSAVLVRWWKQERRPQIIGGLSRVIDQSPDSGLGPFAVTRGELVLMTWTLPFFVTTGLLVVKFMRYLEPLSPFLMLYAAGLLLSIPWKKWRWATIIIVLIASGIQAISFVNLYNQPHPWIAASRWIFENVDQDAVILNEAWDDPLPDAVEVEGIVRKRSEYIAGTVNWLSGVDAGDNRQKLVDNLQQVASADYIVLSSNRNYGVIPRLEDRYPLSSQYYPLLFEGRMGYEVAYVGTRTPNLFGIFAKPDTFSWPDLERPQAVIDYYDDLPGFPGGRFDESFTVYDQPLVIILENTGRLSAEQMVALFDFS